MHRSSARELISHPRPQLVPKIRLVTSSHGDRLQATSGFCEMTGPISTLEKAICEVKAITIDGHLRWEHRLSNSLYYIIDEIPNGQAFAGALIATEKRPAFDPNMMASCAKFHHRRITQIFAYADN